MVIFDEYYGYPSFEEHEFRAWAETRAAFGLVTTPVAISSRSAAFALDRNPKFAK
jgi:hypothetical protein